MIDPKAFVAAVREVGITFMTGVPDSLLKDACAGIAASVSTNHVIAANEGSAVGLAIGHSLATGDPALVYMQNSGLGNAINPLISLADPLVYGIPIVLLIGWRGEILPEGVRSQDEPQHRKQGAITPDLLKVLDIPYRVIDASSDVKAIVGEMAGIARSDSRPVAILVRKGTFSAFVADETAKVFPLTREAAIAAILDVLPENVPVVATTGMASRELFELRTSSNAGHQRDFLTVGGMGHASQIAAGLAMAKPETKVVCIDGDGAMLMHLGGLATTADCENLLHVVINNAAHDSVGGSPTKAVSLDLSKIADACGYTSVARVKTAAEIHSAVRSMLAQRGSTFLEIRCRKGFRSDLGRPDRSPADNKADFMKFLSGPSDER